MMRVPALAVAGLIAALALTGCGLVPGGTGGGNTGDGNAATSGPAPEDGSDDGSGDGGVDPNSVVPATFPSDVPLIDGDVAQAADLGTGWVVMFAVDDALARFTEAADKLAGAGFTEEARQTSETEGFASYTNSDYQVNLSANVDFPDVGPSVSYTVVIQG